MVRAVLSLLLPLSLVLPVVSAKASPCSIEDLCPRYQNGYENAFGERVRASFPENFDWDHFSTQEYDDHLLRIFNETKARFARILEKESTLTTPVRENLIARMLSAELDLQTRKNPRFPYQARFWNDTFKVLALRTLGEFPEVTLVNLFAHELAHAFDTSAITYFLVKEISGDKPRFIEIDDPNRFDPSLRSVIAAPIPRSQFFSIEESLSSKNIHRDHMAEAISDYFATRVSADYIRELSSTDRKRAAFEAVMDLVVSSCQDSVRIDQESVDHLSSRKRLEKIYFENEDIARFAGCK